MRIAPYKERILKTKECAYCHEKLVTISGRQKYHAWCSDIVSDQSNNSYKRSKIMEKRYRIENV